VLVQHIVLEDSLDASMVRTLLKKQQVIDAAVDGAARDDPRRDNLFEGVYAEALLAAASEGAAAPADGAPDAPEDGPDTPETAETAESPAAPAPPRKPRARTRRRR